MNAASQLYHLQEIDQELESTEKALREVTSQLGESKAVKSTRDNLLQGEQQLKELAQKQRSVEWEIDDLSNKLSTIEGDLYSGRIRNPKELTNLQQELTGFKAKRNQLEEKALEIMSQAELTQEIATGTGNELKTLETEWQSQQQQLAIELEQLKTALLGLKDRRQLTAAEIEPQAIEIYQEIKRQKGTAVAKVEQGICRACRIQLPVTELQSTRSGGLVRCSSCRRILFLP